MFSPLTFFLCFKCSVWSIIVTEIFTTETIMKWIFSRIADSRLLMTYRIKENTQQSNETTNTTPDVCLVRTATSQLLWFFWGLVSHSIGLTCMTSLKKITVYSVGFGKFFDLDNLPILVGLELNKRINLNFVRADSFFQMTHQYFGDWEYKLDLIKTYFEAPVTVLTTLFIIFGGFISSFNILLSVARGKPLSSISSRS